MAKFKVGDEVLVAMRSDPNQKEFYKVEFDHGSGLGTQLYGLKNPGGERLCVREAEIISIATTLLKLCYD